MPIDFVSVNSIPRDRVACLPTHFPAVASDTVTPSTATPSSNWRIDADLATFTHGALTATVCVSQPQLGLHNVLVGGRAQAGVELLAPQYASAESWPAPMDCFVRGGDLVITYPFTHARSVRVQIYWRAVPLESAEFSGRCLAAIDSQISVQTPLLDSRPGMLLCSRFAAPRIARMKVDASKAEASPWIFGLSDDVSYVEMIHPSDVESEEYAEVNGQAQLTRRLFDGALEKGVILRARARGVFLTADQANPDNVTALYNQFIHAPLPLTT